MDVRDIVAELKTHSSERNREGMARFGIDTKYALGVSIPHVRALGKKLGKNHELALELWRTKVHEVQILASIVDEPARVTEAQLDEWVLEFNSWDLCDQCCMNLFDKTPFAYAKALAWAKRPEEFVRRAGFALMAALAVHDKAAADSAFLRFLPSIKAAATDERNFVRKAVNWALRQIGKRNKRLNNAAIAAAKEISKIDSKAACWIAADALRELQGSAAQKRLA